MICSLCGKDKTEDEFLWRKKDIIRQKHCVECNRDAIRKHYTNNKAYYIDRNKERERIAKTYALEYLNEHPCVDCGESDPVVLDFDHVRGVKRREVTIMIKMGLALNSIKDEIEKCDIRCANCHRRKHANERKSLFFVQ